MNKSIKRIQTFCLIIICVFSANSVNGQAHIVPTSAATTAGQFGAGTSIVNIYDQATATSNPLTDAFTNTCSVAGPQAYISSFGVTLGTLTVGIPTNTIDALHIWNGWSTACELNHALNNVTMSFYSTGTLIGTETIVIPAPDGSGLGFVVPFVTTYADIDEVVMVVNSLHGGNEIGIIELGFRPAEIACTDLTTTVSATEICLGDELTLTGTSETGGIVTWDGGAPNGIAFVPGAAGIITYTATSSSTDDCEFSVDITIHDLPVVVANADDAEICEGDMVTLTGAGADTYVWDGGVTDGDPFAPAVTTTYMVTGTDANGCENTDDITVTVNPLPIIDAGTDLVVCIGDEATLEGSGAGVGGIYDWSGGVTDGVPFVVAVTTTYTVTGTDANGCINTDDVLVEAVDAPIIDAGADLEICEGEEVTLTGSGAGVGGTYTWTDGVIDGETFTPGATTTYTVTGVDAGGGCENTDDVTVTLVPAPVITVAGVTAVCEGEDLILTGSGAGVGGTYDWTGGVMDGVSFTPIVTGTYTVTGTTALGCSSTTDILVTVNPIPDVNFTGLDLMGCNPYTVDFSTDTPGATHSWTFGDGSVSGIEDPSYTYSIEGSFDVTLTVTSLDGCVGTTTYTDYITVVPQPIAEFNYVATKSNNGMASAQFDNQSLYGETYIWNFGDDSPTSNVEDPTHLYPGISELGYVVELIAINSLGCRDSITKVVSMPDVLLYYIPNTFTPDGDDFNESFQPVFVSGFNVYDFHMAIFNRWGEMVFETFDASQGWNGAYGNKGTVEDGTYIWRIEFGDLITDEKYTEEGHVTILK